MTRKDYVAIADVLATEVSMAQCLTNDTARDAALAGMANVVRALADIFARDNSRFDRARFYAACGATEQGRIPAEVRG